MPTLSVDETKSFRYFKPSCWLSDCGMWNKFNVGGKNLGKSALSSTKNDKMGMCAFCRYPWASKHGTVILQPPMSDTKNDVVRLCRAVLISVYVQPFGIES